MLPSDLLLHRRQGDSLTPRALPLKPPYTSLAAAILDCFDQYRQRSQGELDRALAELEGDGLDYKVVRGLCHLVRNHWCTFEPCGPLDPVVLRGRVFQRSSQIRPTAQARDELLVQVAQELEKELNQPVTPGQIRDGLYGDLPDNQRLTQYDRPAVETLIHRYNLSQVQGVFYKATAVILHAYRNDPGEYKLLFRYLKLFQLMTYIEGDADHGFTITVDGPTSLFKASTRYGLALAKMIPALLHVTRWRLTAQLHWRDPYSKTPKDGEFALDSDCGLVSHYPPGKPYDSLLEESFVKRWQTLKTPWRLEREVDLIPIPGSVMIPDFRLVHGDTGRSFLLEIVGYWRPEYLRKKFSQVHQAQRQDLLLAVSDRLNLEKAGVKNWHYENLPLIWFKDKLVPKAVLDWLDRAELI